MFKKILLVLATAILLSGCAAPATTTEPQATEIIVFAAASMTETLMELGEAYMNEHEDVSILFNFDSSGTLKTQIQEGADCDIMASLPLPIQGKKGRSHDPIQV